MKKLISVVVPAYNAERTIKRCLESILRQTYSNLEVLLINDGSIDSTEDICLKIAENDNRLKVVTIPNGGVSHARNVGIKKATGELITFVDADDYIDADMYQTLNDTMEKYNVPIVHCSYKSRPKLPASPFLWTTFPSPLPALPRFRNPAEPPTSVRSTASALTMTCSMLQ